MIVCIPSRGRPAQLKRLFETFVATRATCTIYVRLDADDPALEEYQGVLRPFFNEHTRFMIGPRVGVGGTLQECFKFYPNEDCYGCMGDDTLMHTPNWDEKLKRAAGSWNIAYPDDVVNGEKLATHPFTGGDFLRALGFWVLPGLSRLYIDTTLDFLGRMYGNLIYCPEVVFEHLHWSTGKSTYDATSEKPSAANDRDLFMAWRQNFKIDPKIAEAINGSRIAA